MGTKTINLSGEMRDATERFVGKVPVNLPPSINHHTHTHTLLPHSLLAVSKEDLYRLTTSGMMEDESLIRDS